MRSFQKETDREHQPTVAVYVRHAQQAGSRFLDRVPIDNLTGLTNCVGRWGVLNLDETSTAHSVSGRFICVADGVHFEILVEDKPDSD